MLPKGSVFKNKLIKTKTRRTSEIDLYVKERNWIILIR